MKIVLSGGTGFIGSKLIPFLIEKENELILLTRNAERAQQQFPNLRVVAWTPKEAGQWQRCIDGADAVIHLAGKGILDKRWNRQVKKEIVESRVLSTQLLVEAILQSTSPPSVFLSASGVGIYGEVTSPTTENNPVGDGFLASVCRDWEQPLESLHSSSTRAAAMRIGVVLGEAGALPKMKLNMRLLSGFGDDTQFLSWIHWLDVCQVIWFALHTDTVSGPLNVTAPIPVTMKQSTVALAKAMGKSFWLPIPKPAIRLALGEMADAVLIGQNAVPGKLNSLGYQFKYRTIEEALQDLL